MWVCRIVWGVVGIATHILSASGKRCIANIGGGGYSW